MAVNQVRRFSYCQLLRFRTVFGASGLKKSSRCISTSSSHQGEHQQEEEQLNHQYDILYPGHISTSFFQKSLLAFGSGITCMLNPARDDMICALGETTGSLSLNYLYRKMVADPEGRQILEEKPEINTKTIDIDYLGRLPEGTFGKEYWNFLSVNESQLQTVKIKTRIAHCLESETSKPKYLEFATTGNQKSKQWREVIVVVRDFLQMPEDL